MACPASDEVPLAQVCARSSELADQAKAGAESFFTENGDGCVVLIDTDRSDHHHRLERERIRGLLIDDARRGLADIAAGRTFEADQAIGLRPQRRTAAAKAVTLASLRDATSLPRG